jgi:ABC-type Na+ efflux pump permease subunit
VSPRVWVVVRKEFREFRRNRFVVATMVALPLVFLIVPIGNVLSLKESTSPGGVQGVVGSALLTFFLVPLILPTVISAYAVIGEREQGTLEPVLTTPIVERELLLGKALAALVPTVSIAYGLFAAFAVAVRVAAVRAAVDLVWQAPQFVAVALFAPLLSAFSVWVGLAMSVRSSDVRVAQQLSALSVLPLTGLLALFTFRVVTPSVGLAVGVGVVLAVIDVLAWRVVSAMFDRERLLTGYAKR